MQKTYLGHLAYLHHYKPPQKQLEGPGFAAGPKVHQPLATTGQGVKEFQAHVAECFSRSPALLKWVTFPLITVAAVIHTCGICLSYHTGFYRSQVHPEMDRLIA